MSEALKRLTNRECDVLKLIAAGKSNKEVAAELGLSKSTVKGYVASILVKLDVPSRTAARMLLRNCGARQSKCSRDGVSGIHGKGRGPQLSGRL